MVKYKTVINRKIEFILLSIVVFITIVGCTVTKRAYIQESEMIDYSKYAEKGFFITESNSVSFEYAAIGSISAKVESGYEIIGANKKKAVEDDIYPKQSNINVKIKYGDYISATPEAAIEELYNKAIENGANGVINLRIDPITTYIQQYGNIITGYFCTGMAIKR